MSVVQSETDDIGATIVSPLASTAEFAVPANVNAAVVPRDGAYGAFGLGDGTVQFLALDGSDGNAPATSGAAAFRHNGAVTALRVAAEGFISAGQDGRVVHWPAPHKANTLIDFAGRWVDAVAVDETTGRIAAACRDCIAVVDAQGKSLTRADGFPSSVSGLAFAPDGKRVAAAHLDGVTLVSAASGAHDLVLEWKGSQTGLTWSPDGRFVVTATQERELHVWDLVTMQDFRMGGYPHKVRDMRWSRGGEYLFCTGADVVTGWSFAGAGPSGKPPVEIGYVYNGLVTAIAAYPERPLVAGGYSTGAVLIGGAARGEAILARPAGPAPITALCWSPDGRKLLAGSEAGEAVLIQVPDDLEL